MRSRGLCRRIRRDACRRSRERDRDSRDSGPSEGRRHAVWYNKKARCRNMRASGLFVCIKCRQRPTLPHSFPCSTIGGSRLNFRVRNGNGCDPTPVTTGKRGAWGPRLCAWRRFDAADLFIGLLRRSSRSERSRGRPRQSCQRANQKLRNGGTEKRRSSVSQLLSSSASSDN